MEERFRGFTDAGELPSQLQRLLVLAQTRCQLDRPVQRYITAKLKISRIRAAGHLGSSLANNHPAWSSFRAGKERHRMKTILSQNMLTRIRNSFDCAANIQPS